MILYVFGFLRFEQISEFLTKYFVHFIDLVCGWIFDLRHFDWGADNGGNWTPSWYNPEAMLQQTSTVEQARQNASSPFERLSEIVPTGAGNTFRLIVNINFKSGL